MSTQGEQIAAILKKHSKDDPITSEELQREVGQDYWFNYCPKCHRESELRSDR